MRRQLLQFGFSLREAAAWPVPRRQTADQALVRWTKRLTASSRTRPPLNSMKNYSPLVETYIQT